MRVGVIIPLHNKRGEILRAVTSVLNQTHRDLQLMVVDDGSTDGGGELVEGIVDPRVSVLRSAQKGPGSARNVGLRSLDTPWIGLLDADDEWYPDFLANTTAVAAAHPQLSAVYVGFATDAGNAETAFVKEGVVDDYYTARLQDHIAMTSSSVLLNRSKILEVGGFVDTRRYAEDLETWFRLVCSGSVYYLPQRLCCIHMDSPVRLSGTVSHREKAEGLRALFEVHEQYLREGRIPSALSQSSKRFMESQRVWRAELLILSGKRLAGLGALMKLKPHRDDRGLYWRILKNLLARH